MKNPPTHYVPELEEYFKLDLVLRTVSASKPQTALDPLGQQVWIRALSCMTLGNGKTSSTSVTSTEALSFPQQYTSYAVPMINGGWSARAASLSMLMNEAAEAWATLHQVLSSLYTNTVNIHYSHGFKFKHRNIRNKLDGIQTLRIHTSPQEPSQVRTSFTEL